MKVIIHPFIKNSNQSSPSTNGKWIIKFPQAENHRFSNSVMGWTSNTDMNQELNLTFHSKESAIEFTKSKNWDFEEIQPHKRKIIKKSYADNFI